MTAARPATGRRPLWFKVGAVLLGLLAAVVLLIRRPRIARRDLVTHVWMAFLTQFVYLGLIFTGIDHGIPAGATALIGSLQPVLIATVAGPLLGERVRAGSPRRGPTCGPVSPTTSMPVMARHCCSCYRSAVSSVWSSAPVWTGSESRTPTPWTRSPYRAWCRRCCSSRSPHRPIS